jgi:hypothetical protein
MRVTSMILSLTAVVIMTACGGSDGGKTDIPDGKIYGAGVTSGQTIKISELLDSPEQYLGQTVRVKGPVVNLCKRRGCWMDIASDKEMQTIQLAVDDNEIVFGPELIGQTALVEGELEGIPLTHEQAVSYLASEAECQGDDFDPASVPEDGITFYRIKGTGAVIVSLAAD